MDIALLKTFIEVARTRHFGKAAEHLCVTQSAVSARVKLLETTLGVDVFNRRRNDIQLTPAGHRLLRYAETIVRSWDRARHELALDDRFERSLAVGCQLDLWPIRVRDWAAGLRVSHPDLALQIELLPADILVQRIAADQLDLVFVFEPPRSPDLEIKQIAAVELILVADRPDLDAAQATAHGYILVDWGTPFMMAHSTRYPDLAPATIRLSQGLLAFDLLRRVGGAAYLPRPVVEDALAAGELFEVTDAEPIERYAYAAFRPGAGNRELVGEALKGLPGGRND